MKADRRGRFLQSVRRSPAFGNPGARRTRAGRRDRQGRKLGYIPYEDNAAVSQLLDRGETLEAAIFELKESPYPWERIKVEVRWKS